MKDWIAYLLIAGIFVILGGLYYVIYQEKSACTSQGGTLVRGVFWYECVGTK